jgi:hypothetical protein
VDLGLWGLKAVKFEMPLEEKECKSMHRKMRWKEALGGAEKASLLASSECTLSL